MVHFYSTNGNIDGNIDAPMTILQKRQEKQILETVKTHMGWNDKKTMLWYRAKNLNFGGTCPKCLVKAGRGHKVIEFIEDAIQSSGRGPFSTS